jgi:hypothetical protein
MNDQNVADGSNVASGAGEVSKPATSEGFGSYDDWLAKQDSGVQKLVGDNVTKLKSALDAERSERKALAKQIAELTKQAGQGTELAKQLESLQGEISQQTRRAEFYEAVGNSKINVASAKLALLAAQADGLFEEFVDRRSGKIKYSELLDELATRYPDLAKPVATTAAKTNGGAGVSNIPAKSTINDLLRQRAFGGR